MDHPDACPVCRAPLRAPIARLDGWPTTMNRALSSPAAARAVPRAALSLVGCDGCGWVVNRAFRQTDHFDEAYSCAQEYSDTWVSHQHRQLDSVLRGRSYRHVVEIGCGGGWVCDQLRRRGLKSMGFEPTYRGTDPAIEPRAYRPGEPLEADLVYLQHVLDEVPELGDFVQGLARSAPDADVVIDVLDAGRLGEPCGVLDLAVERCNYATWPALAGLFDPAGVGSVERLPGRPGYLLLRARLSALSNPVRAGAASVAPHPLPDLERQGLALARACADAEGPLYVWGASNRGGNLAHLADPDASRIRALVDLSPAKQGRFLPGTGHPIWAPHTLARAAPGLIVIANEAYVGEILAMLADWGPGWRTVSVGDWTR